MSQLERYASHLPASPLLYVKARLALQVATTATFAACALEALRMLLADLEQPGGTLTTPIKAPMALLLPIAITLFPVALPAGFVGKMAAAAVRLAALCVGLPLAAFAVIVHAVVMYALHSAANSEECLHPERRSLCLLKHSMPDACSDMH